MSRQSKAIHTRYLFQFFRMYIATSILIEKVFCSIDGRGMGLAYRGLRTFGMGTFGMAHKAMGNLTDRIVSCQIAQVTFKFTQSRNHRGL